MNTSSPSVTFDYFISANYEKSHYFFTVIITVIIMGGGVV